MKKLLLTIILVVMVVGSFMSDFNTMSKDEVNDSFKKAIAIFATAKGLNAAISVAQTTKIGPVAIGEVLDPINDMIEQFSWVMIAALTSLGIQKILLSITADMAFNIFVASVVGIFIIMVWIKERIDKRYFSAGAKIVLILLFARFAVPLNSYAKQFVYKHYIAKTEFNIEKNNNSLNLSTDNIEKLSSKDPNSSWISTIKNFNFSQKIKYLKKEISAMSDYIVNLIVIYIFETLFFPIVFLLLFYKLMKNSLIL